MGDYIYRFFKSEPLIHSCEVLFQSFIYQWAFWTLIVFYHWLVYRNLKSSLRFYLPLVGLGCYALFSILSTESVPFLYPLTSASTTFNLMKPGYLVLLIPISLVWFTRKWTKLSLLSLGCFSFLFLAGFLIAISATVAVIENSLTEPFTNSERLSILPGNHFYSEWHVVAVGQGKYHFDRYELFRGLKNDLRTRREFEDFELTQNILLNPLIHCIYYHSFKNPVASIDIQKEKLILDIAELIPSNDLFEVENLVMIQNKSGQIVNLQVNYRLFYWFHPSVHI